MEVLTFGRHCSRSAMLAVAFLGRDSAITKQAQMALAAPSVQASSVLLSLNRSVNCYLETDKVARFFSFKSRSLILYNINQFSTSFLF